MKKTKSTLIPAEKEAFLQQANEAYAEMKKDPQRWQEYQEELTLWDVTLEDGLESTLSEWNSNNDNEDFHDL